MVATPLITTVVSDGPQPHLDVSETELRVTSGPDRGLAVKLEPDTQIIGSGADCHIVLHDPTVSARHAEIRVCRRMHFVHDLDSTNGLFVGNTRITAAPLCDGLRLRLGGTILQVRALGTHRTIPLGSPGRFGGLVAHSLSMRAVIATLEQLAPTDVTVLIEGATGTGKEVAALALHQTGPRAQNPFVVVDCGALNPHLAAAELFGVERGAFSGADTTRPGLIEEAEGGTLFLDEVGELPLDLQTILLGVIERRSSRRVGGSKARSHDVRIIAATNRNLAEEVRGKRFRQDLYYRLAVARVRLPRLRERPEDLPILAHDFAAEYGVVIPAEVVNAFLAHDWPGNVRELKNTVARIAASPGSSPPVTGGTLSSIFDERERVRPLPEARRHAGETFERNYLVMILSLAKGSTARAAELAGVSRRLMRLLLARHQLRATQSEE